MSIYGVSTVVLFILKVTGVLAISWWFVFAPVLVGLLIGLIFRAIVESY